MRASAASGRPDEPVEEIVPNAQPSSVAHAPSLGWSAVFSHIPPSRRLAGVGANPRLQQCSSATSFRVEQSLSSEHLDMSDSPFPRPRVYHQPGTVDERPIDAAASLDEPHHRVAIDGIHESGLALLDSSLDGRARQIETELFAAR